MSVQVVRTVGRYEIVREIGRGGMAVVYLARQTDLDRLVALKELAAFRASDADVVERFLRESRLAGSLNHPSIVTVHEYFEHDGTAFIAMEYFERGSLRPLVGRVSPAQAGGVLEGLLAGLAHAERRGIVHRDLKPENVMVTAEGGVKIADFGIAKAVQGPAARTLTDAGAAVGTPAYMAPELVTGGEVGPWTDLYGLGVTAFELLAGRLPFDDDDLALALMLRHASEPAPPLRSFRPDLDHALCVWVDGLLAKAAAERPSSATDAAEELDEIMIAWLGPRWRRQARLTEGGLPVTGQPRGSDTPIADAVATPELAAPRRRLPRRGRLAAAGVVVAALAALAAAILFVGGSDEPSAAAKPIPDLVPRPADRLGAEAAGPAAFVSDPAGRIVALDRATLAVSETLRDPSRPRAVAFARGAVLVADDQGVSALDAESLALRAARALPGASLLVASQGMAAVAARGGQVCVVGAGLRLDPCVRVPFAPAGLGVDGDGRVYVVNAGAGTVLQYQASQRRLVRVGRAVPVGAGAHGRLLVHGGLLYVAVRRGIAVVDPAAGRPRTVRLPVTPSDLWLSGSGRLFAALPGLDRVAVVDPGADAAPRLVRAVQNPVALAGAAAGPVLVVGADGTLARLDPATGAVLGTRRAAALSAPAPQRLVLRRVESRTEANGLTLSFELVGGALDATSLVVRDATIADGRAAFELWQGGIASVVRVAGAGELDVRVARAPGRLVVVLSAPAGAYERLRLGAGPRTITVTMSKTPPPAAPTRGGGSTGGTTTTPSQKPKQKPPPPQGSYDVY